MTAKVLVVDDIEFNVKLLETKLKRDYYQVFTAGNGEEAIIKAKQVQPDIILMDVMMPIMDGFQATEKIKTDLETAHIPIIMVTALNAQEDKVKGLEAGADDFLTKPINDHALMTRLRSLVRLKIMTDELRIRDVTSQQFGLGNFDIVKRNRVEGARVLLIDDDRIQAEKIKNKLSANKIETDILVDVANFMEIVEHNKYSLVIVSTLLLNEDGLRICSELRSHSQMRFVPILILVDENDPLTLDKGLELGVSDYLISPIDHNELMARSVTQIRRKNYQDELKDNYLSSLTNSVTDPLTGIHNRRYFDIHGKNIFSQALATKNPFSLIMVDIDNFKSVNDTYGHQSGDEIIKEIAKRISENLRLTDLCSRYGGEEFVVILANTPIFSGQFVGERIRMLIESVPFKIPVNPGSLEITISMGISEIKSEIDTFESVIARADQNLYKAKHTGKNQIISDSTD